MSSRFPARLSTVGTPSGSPEVRPHCGPSRSSSPTRPGRPSQGRAQAGKGPTGQRLSHRYVDAPACGRGDRGDRGGDRGRLPPRSRLAGTTPDGLEPSAPGPASDRARRRGQCEPVEGRLAPGKKLQTPQGLDLLPRRERVLPPPLGEGHLGAQGQDSGPASPLQLEVPFDIRSCRIRTRRQRCLARVRHASRGLQPVPAHRIPQGSARPPRRGQAHADLGRAAPSSVNGHEDLDRQATHLARRRAAPCIRARSESGGAHLGHPEVERTGQPLSRRHRSGRRPRRWRPSTKASTVMEPVGWPSGSGPSSIASGVAASVAVERATYQPNPGR